MKKYLLLIFVLIFVSSVYAACTFEDRGVHGVEIDGECHDCNEISDGICPEDFFDPATDWSCEGIDPDCAPGACVNCEDCGAGILDLCDYDKCLSCGNCYFIDGFLVDDCRSCDEITSCPDYLVEGDGITCDNDDCSINCEADPETMLCVPKFDDTQCDVTINSCSDYDENSCYNDPCGFHPYDVDHIFGEGDDVCAWEMDLGECKPAYLCDLDVLVPTVDEAECNSLKEGNCEYDCGSCPCTLISGEAGCPATMDCPPGGAVAGPSYQEPIQAFPIFTWFNLIIASLIIIGFYMFIHKKK